MMRTVKRFMHADHIMYLTQKTACGSSQTAKMSVRNARRDAIEEFKKLQKQGLPEDAEKDAEDDIQKTHDKFIKKIDELFAAKEKEIMTV